MSLEVRTPVGDDAWRAAFAESRYALVRGTDSKRGERPAPQHCDVVLSTRDDDAIVSYVPGDGVITARAGARISALRTAVAEGGHHVVPLLGRDAGTIGGAIAAGRSGADRLRFGPLRHHVLGAKILLANGQVVKSGGALVKNVTGYDLHRLWTGAHGAFGALLEVSLRLFPAPEIMESATIGELERDEAFALARTLALTPLRPFAIEATSDGSAWRVRVVHGASRRVLDSAWEQSGALAPALSQPSSEFEFAEEPEGDALLRLASRPTRFAADVALLHELVGSGPILTRPGVAEAILAVGGDPLEAERSIARTDLAVTWRRAPEPVLRAALVRERCAPGFDLMRRLRERYDPDARFAPGRFFGGL